LLSWPFGLSWPHWLRRGLDGRPRLWNLLRHPGWRLWPYALPWMQFRLVNRPGRRTLLNCSHGNRLAALDGQWFGHHYRLRPSAIFRHELGTVGAGNHPVLLLHPQLGQTRLPQSS
jgi:hypothetical protein